MDTLEVSRFSAIFRDNDFADNDGRPGSTFVKLQRASEQSDTIISRRPALYPRSIIAQRRFSPWKIRARS